MKNEGFKCRYVTLGGYQSTAYIDTDEPDLQGNYYGTNKHTDDPVILRLSASANVETPGVWMEYLACSHSDCFEEVTDSKGFQCELQWVYTDETEEQEHSIPGCGKFFCVNHILHGYEH